MKKLISLLAALSVVTAFSVGATATEFTVEGSQTGLTATDAAQQVKYEKGDNGLYTVDLSAVAGQQAQTTILAVKGTTISVGSIQYIGQSATPTFSFDLKDNLTEKVNVLAGGSSISPTLVGYMEPEAQAPETFTVSGTVSGYAGTTLPTVKVYNGAEEVAVATVLADGTFTVDVPVLAEGSYTLKATKAGHLSYTKANISAAATVTATLKAGDLNADNIANVSDMALVVDNYNAEKGNSGYTAAYDANEDNIMNVSDMALVVDNYNAESISE